MSILLTHETTEAEHLLRIELVQFLRRIKFSGEVNCRSFLANQEGKVRRPDFYLPRYGLAIEVDGRTRDSWQVRQEDIEPRDLFYQSIGARPPLIVAANWTVSEHKLTRFKFELEHLLHNNRLTPRERNTINKRIHDGRKLFEKRNPGIFDGNGTTAPQFLYQLGHLNEIRHFGGTTFKLRGKYKTAAIRGIGDLQKILDSRKCALGSLGPTDVYRFIKALRKYKLTWDKEDYWIDQFATQFRLDPDRFRDSIHDFLGTHKI